MTTATTATTAVRHRGTSGLLSPAVVAMSVMLAAVATATSLTGLLTEWAYAAETGNWRLQARAQDLGNLLAVAALTLATRPARRGSVRALSLWAGACVYLGYVFVIYAMTLHFGPLFLAYVAGLGLSAFCLLFTFPAFHWRVSIPERRVRLATAVLATIGVGFALLWLASIGSALASGQPPPDLVAAGLVANPVQVLDLALILPAMVTTAILARRGSARARLLLGPWLAFSSLMAASMVTIIAMAGGPVGLQIGLLVITAASAAVCLVVLREPYATLSPPETTLTDSIVTA